MLVTMGGQELD